MIATRKELLQFYIKDKARIEHSMSTAQIMKKWAKYFSIDEERAFFVGFYHDIGKGVSDNDMLDYASFY